ncbi:MAG: transglycosylase domain-containing protein [Chloroflexota bacterium]
MNWFFRKTGPVYPRRLRRRVQGKRPLFGERHFAWHESRSVNAFRVVLGLFMAVVLLLTSVSGALAAGSWAFFSRDLPSVDLVFDRRIPQSSLVYDREGNLLDEIYDPDFGHRILTPLRDLGENVVKATLAAEDPNFYSNPGVDPIAIVRAVVLNLQGGTIVSGASTLTMQLVRNTVFTPEERDEQSFLRKIRESLLAVNMASHYSKDDILEMYLNEVFYGNHAFGAEAAALTFFGKHAKELSVAEAAMIAGMPQAPTDYNPYLEPELAVRRQYYVLDQMVKYNFLSQAEADKAREEPLYLGARQTRFKEAPHFAQYVRSLLLERFGREAVYYGGLRVRTTVDLNMQKAAQATARQHIERVRSSHATNSSIVSIDPKTGEVLVMLGSVDYFDEAIDGQVNIATSPRQPGSSIKPYTYLTAYQKLGYIPASVTEDRPMAFPQRAGLPPYAPRNWNFQWNGVQPLRTALASSLNIAAVLLLANVGVPSMVDTAHKMGITTLDRPIDQYGLAITLGAAELKLLDHTYAYSVFANNGELIGAPVPEANRKPGYAPYEPVVLKEVTNYRGDVLLRHTPQPQLQVVPAEYAYLITASLVEDEGRRLTYGANSYLQLSRPNTAKTGTTENRNDSWTMGYTPDLVTGVWVGNADNSPMLDVAGVSGAGRIFHDYMEEVLKDKPKTWFPVPPKITEGPVCGTYDVYVVDRAPQCTVVPLFAMPAPQTASAPSPAS